MIRGPEPHKDLFRTQCKFEMRRPGPSKEDVIELRRENLVEVEVDITEKADLLWDHITISNIGPTGDSGIHRGDLGLELTLKVEGATTGTPFNFACIKCSKKAPSGFPNSSLFDFVAKEGLVWITKGKARIAFRFRCLPRHHGTRDTEYW
jgi:hypothetical protein